MDIAVGRNPYHHYTSFCCGPMIYCKGRGGKRENNARFPEMNWPSEQYLLPSPVLPTHLSAANGATTLKTRHLSDVLKTCFSRL